MSAGNLRRILWESEDQRDLCFAMIGGFYLLILTKEKKWSGKTFSWDLRQLLSVS